MWRLWGNVLRSQTKARCCPTAAGSWGWLTIEEGKQNCHLALELFTSSTKYIHNLSQCRRFFFFFFQKNSRRGATKLFRADKEGKCKKVIIKSTEKYIFCLFTALSISFYSKNGEICAPFLLERTCSNLVLSPTSILYLEKKQKTLS